MKKIMRDTWINVIILLFVAGVLTTTGVWFIIGMNDLLERDSLENYQKVQLEVKSINVAGLEVMDTFEVADIYEKLYIDSYKGSYFLRVKYRHPDSLVTNQTLKPATIDILNFREL